MAKGDNRGKPPTAKTVATLVARAGGRCQFENCNKNVFLFVICGFFAKFASCAI